MTARDIMSDPLPPEGFVEGRRVVAVIGIDRYRAWPPLNNAVNDAQGALDVFQRLGFEQIVAPLIDETATADAIRRLVTDDLATLGSGDSLVLFVAGHGHTQTRSLQSGPVQTGFLIPVDGDPPEGRTASWLRLDTWLSDVARLPARHILVILDACHSGIALGSLIKWRGDGALRHHPLDELRRRQSRRVITSALGDQLAMDNGPIDGHSLFTGCLIEGLTSGLARAGHIEATGSEIGVYVQQRVTSYPGSRQTPDFGTLELDNRGELVISTTTNARSPRQTSNPPIEMNLAAHSSKAIRESDRVVMVRRDGQDAGRRGTEISVQPAARSIPIVASRRWVPESGYVSMPRQRATTGLNKVGKWFATFVAVTMTGVPLGIGAAISAATSVLLVIAPLLIVTAIVIGRVVATAPPIIRTLSAKLLHHKLWTAGAIAVLLLGAGVSLRVRELDRECSQKLAVANALQQENRDGASTAFADATKACAAAGRKDDVRRAKQTAGAMQPDPAEPPVSTPPIPPEPSPRLAEKAGEVPALEAKLITDKGYVTAWTANHSFERETLLTAISEIVAHGSLPKVLDTAIKKAGLTEAIAIMSEIFIRNGKLSADFTNKVEAYLTANETAPRRGLWNPYEKGKPLVDATALAMWLHPNDSQYVRERMLSLVNGPFPYTGKEPMARRWLAHVGDVAERLNALGAFTKTDCTALGFEFHETTTQGKTSASCDPPADGKSAAASDIKAKP